MKLDSPRFDVVCPRCNSRAVGHTVQDGTWGSYREVYLNYKVEKITCGYCGAITQCSNESKPKLWFYTEIDGCSVWSHNEDRLRGLRQYLVEREDEIGGYQDYLPKKLLNKSTSERVIKWIDEQLDLIASANPKDSFSS